MRSRGTRTGGGSDVAGRMEWIREPDTRGVPENEPARDAEGKPFTGILTGNSEADAMIHDMVTEGGEPWDSAVSAMYEANDHTFALPANPADAEFTTAMQDAVNSVLNGEATAEDALAKAQDSAQKSLDDAWAKLESAD